MVPTAHCNAFLLDYRPFRYKLNHVSLVLVQLSRSVRASRNPEHDTALLINSASYPQQYKEIILEAYGIRSKDLVWGDGMFAGCSAGLIVC